MKDGDGYGTREIVYTFTVPFGVLQQQLVYDVQAEKRKIYNLTNA